MNTTINEEIAHDCVQELLKKLSDERKLSSDQNARIAEMEEANGKMSAFIAAWEIHLADRILSYGRSNKTGRALEDAQQQHNELKAQHLGDDSKTS